MPIVLDAPLRQLLLERLLDRLAPADRRGGIAAALAAPMWGIIGCSRCKATRVAVHDVVAERSLCGRCAVPLRWVKPTPTSPNAPLRYRQAREIAPRGVITGLKFPRGTLAAPADRRRALYDFARELDELVHLRSRP